MKYLILLIFLCSCATKHIDIECEEDIAKYEHSCPKYGHGACPFCEEVILFEKNLLTNNLK
jgi:hypothetical protein